MDTPPKKIKAAMENNKLLEKARSYGGKKSLPQTALFCKEPRDRQWVNILGGADVSQLTLYKPDQRRGRNLHCTQDDPLRHDVDESTEGLKTQSYFAYTLGGEKTGTPIAGGAITHKIKNQHERKREKESREIFFALSTHRDRLEPPS